MELILNVYSVDKKEIEKVYRVDSLDLMFGTVEDIINVIDIDKINDNTAVAMMIVKAWWQLKPFLKDIFPGVTDDEIKRVKINEMIPLFSDIFAAIGENIGLLVNEKNANRA